VILEEKVRLLRPLLCILRRTTVQTGLERDFHAAHGITTRHLWVLQFYCENRVSIRKSLLRKSLLQSDIYRYNAAVAGLQHQCQERGRGH